jgi:hypothetical protein
MIVMAVFGLNVPMIGMITTASVIIASQLVAASLIDHLTLLGPAHRPLSVVRIAGMGPSLGSIDGPPVDAERSRSNRTPAPRGHHACRAPNIRRRING